MEIRLFARESRRATLTAAGHELLNEGRVLLKAASDLECRIQQLAKGWETELRIAVDTIIGSELLFPMIAAFDNEKSGTRVRLSTEVLGGTWDALISGRADLIIGAGLDAPSGGGYAMLPMGAWTWQFVASPDHPIVHEPLPLTEATITRYRAISVADSSRQLAPRTVGLISGQDVLTVPSMQAKLAAHIAGMGVGFLPTHLALPAINANQLVALAVAIPRRESAVCVAWRANNTGRAQRWFIQQFEKPEIAATIFPVEVAT